MWRPVRGVLADIRFGLRMIGRAPGIALTAVLSVAIGVAASTAAFSVINALVFRPAPGLAGADRLVHVYPGGQIRASGLDDYSRARDSLPGLSGLAAFARTTAAVDVGREPIVVRVAFVSDNYFEILGARAAVGRTLDRIGAGESIAVASDRFAARHFEAPAEALGRFITVNGHAVQVAGILPPGFAGHNPGDLGDERDEQPQLWLPMAARPTVDSNREQRSVELVGRMADGATIQSVQRQGDQLLFSIGDRGTPRRTLITPLGVGPGGHTIDAALVVSLVMTVPLIVLAIGCANTAGLLIARASQREAEVAVRLALGATRARIARQLLIESLMVAAAAGGVGTAAAITMTSVFEELLPVPVPLDWRVLAFTLTTVATTGIAFGAAPALTAARRGVSDVLKDTAVASPLGRSRLRRALVIGQVALSLLLLVLGALFVRGVGHLQRFADDRGLDRVAAAAMRLDLLRYSPVQGRAFQDEVLARVEGIPGVESAALAPFDPFNAAPPIAISRSAGHEAQPILVGGAATIGRFLQTAGIRIVRGRPFTDAELRRAQPDAVILSAALAERLFPDESAINGTLFVGEPGSNQRPVVVVGIAADVRVTPFAADRRWLSVAYLPAPVAYAPAFSIWLRTAGDPRVALPQVRALVRDMDARLPILEAAPAESWRDREIAPLLWIANGVGGLGGVALALAAGGLYAVVAFLVASRRHEIAIRLALGATAGQLVALVLRDGLRLSMWGTALGLVLSALATGVARAVFAGMSPFDPAIFVGVSALLISVALMAILAPAIRASRIDPIATLRRQ